MSPLLLYGEVIVRFNFLGRREWPTLYRLYGRPSLRREPNRIEEKELISERDKSVVVPVKNLQWEKTSFCVRMKLFSFLIKPSFFLLW